MISEFIVITLCVIMKETAATGMYTHVQGETEDTIVRPKYPAYLLNGKLGRIDQELSKCGGINILEISITKLQILFEKNKLTASQLTRCYLERIRRMDPYLHAVIEINPDAMQIAEELDLERRYGKVRGPLHGIPILIKDNMATTDKMQTTAGSLALLGLKPRNEAVVVKKLRKAGAVILGKTNLSEFAYFRGTGIPGGWSSRGNQTFCPYVLSQDPSGSSTGSAVATAANMAVCALGTETDGSIISPSHHQSMVGLKTTTHGHVSTEGVIPISFTQDTVGPMTRSVLDAAILFNVIADGKSQFYPNLKKKYRIGVLRDPFWRNNAEQNTKLEKALVELKSSPSVTLVDPVRAAPGLILKITGEKERVVLLHEFKVGINKYLRQTDEEPLFANKMGKISSLADIIAFNKDHPVPEGYNQNLLIWSQDTDGLKNRTYLQMRKENMMAAKEVFAETLRKYKLDAIVTPTEQPNAKDIISDHSFSLAAIAGYPAVTVPAGFTSDNLPFGITFMGKTNSENTLLNIAFIMEEKLQARRRPHFLP